MTTILPAARNSGDVIGNMIGDIMSQHLPNQMQQGFNRGQLQNAFNNLDPKQNYMDQLKAIAPIMLSTPGGAQALESIAPLLAKRAENEAFKKFYDDQKAKRNQQSTGQGAPSSLGGSQGDAQGQPPQPQQVKPLAPNDEAAYRNPEAYRSPESLFPEQAAGPQEQKEMSQPEIQDAALDLMAATMDQGKPISYQDAQSTVVQQNEIIKAQNDRIRQEKQAANKANKALTAGMVKRAENSGLLKDPEDSTVVEKLALEAKRLPNENDQWKYVRNGMRQFDSHKSNLQRSASIPGPLERIWRKATGTHQDTQEIIKSIQPDIDAYKKYGLYDELRRDLAEYIGLGPEQVESAIFPLNKEAKSQIASIPRNPKKLKSIEGDERFGVNEIVFPGEEFSVKGSEFDSLKDGIEKVLKNNPDINLVSLRGDLNQGKRYAWQDITRAVEELTEEGRFSPDVIQEKQLGIIAKPPAPGLWQLFMNTWTGKK